MKKLLSIVLSISFIAGTIKADSITNAYLQKQPGVEQLRAREIENSRVQAQINNAPSSTQEASVPANGSAQKVSRRSYTRPPKVRITTNVEELKKSGMWNYQRSH